MKIAVLMSTYNGEQFIHQQIESILAQDLNMEVDIWVRDDGSQDATQQILQEYQTAGRLRWYTGLNLKPAKSFLDLVSHCPGYDYYAFADQDDYWYADKLRSGTSVIAERKGPAMSFSNARLVDGKGNPLGRNVYKDQPHCDFYSVLCGGGILGCTIVFNRQLAELLRAFSKPEKVIMHDYYAAIICTLFDGTISYDPIPHMDYRQHGSNVVGAQWTKMASIKNRVRNITKKRDISVADMAQSILKHEMQSPNPEKLKYLREIAEYKRSVFSAIKTAFSRKPTYNSKNMELTARLAFLLRNR